MNAGVSLSILVVGVMLFIWGFNISESLSSDISRVFTGTPTDKSVWLMIGGVGMSVVGLYGLARKP